MYPQLVCGMPAFGDIPTAPKRPHGITPPYPLLIPQLGQFIPKQRTFTHHPPRTSRLLANEDGHYRHYFDTPAGRFFRFQGSCSQE